MYALMTLSFSVFCNFQTCMSIRRQPECSVPMPCTISSKCLQMRASQAVHSRVSFTPGCRCRHTRIPSCTPSFAHAHHDAGRCCGRKSDAPAAPPWRVGVRPRFSARSIRLPRRVLHCSRDFASKQTMSSEWSSAGRASACHRACSSAADELAGRSL